MNRSVLAACLGWMFSAVDIILLILFQQDVADALGVSVQVIKMATGVGLLLYGARQQEGLIIGGRDSGRRGVWNRMRSWFAEVF